MKKTFFLLLFAGSVVNLQAQDNFAWHEPKRAEGICERDSSHIFYRLPGYMQPLVRKAVWDLSLNTAGEFLRFKTTARSFTVRYTLASKNLSLPHMPATGVSGVDLYALDRNGSWNWSPPKYSFGDTCVFVYKNLLVASGSGMADFYLYLPLYNTIQWISIGAPGNEQFEFVAGNQGKPIVAYGTSILQGAVASRPGLAWSNILERKLNREVINLGFSGNGRFEKPIFDLMAGVDAKIYILDCMPNLTRGAHISDEEVKSRVYYGIARLREKHPGVPILLAEHADGYTPFNMDTALLNDYHEASLLMAKIYGDLKIKGIKNIYLLSDKDIRFDTDCTTEGTHPNDIGMMKYARAYAEKIREIRHI
jgi:lysophospholipase L1-like esterase